MISYEDPACKFIVLEGPAPALQKPRAMGVCQSVSLPDLEAYSVADPMHFMVSRPATAFDGLDRTLLPEGIRSRTLQPLRTFRHRVAPLSRQRVAMPRRAARAPRRARRTSVRRPVARAGPESPPGPEEPPPTRRGSYAEVAS